MNAKTEDSRPIVGDPSATFFQGNGSVGAAAIAAERPHLDMRAEDMFPESAEPVQPGTVQSLFSVPVPDDGPREQWLYRVTKEMAANDVLRLFQIAPHMVTRRALEAIDVIYGEAAVRLMKMTIPNADATYRHPRRGRVRRFAEHLADRFLDMVPRGELNFARNQFTLQERARAARAAVEGAKEMAGTVRDAIVAIETQIFPGMNAKTVEGETFRGERVVAVWGGVDERGKPTEPTRDPEF